MLCPTGNRFALNLAEAKRASLLAGVSSRDDDVPLRLREGERANAERSLVDIRLAYVEHTAMCPICVIT
jgi:hypothetical protein